MGNCKVCVYTICKNEEKFVDRWMDSMGEADLVVVLDTGSKDGTVERLRARGAQVTVERILPWRFDAARNRSLELVPEDVDLCVCTDLDEVFHPGWREALERPGGLGAAGSPIAIPGASSRTARRGLYSGAIRSTPAGATGGSTRYTRCSSGRGRALRGPLWRRRGSSWTTTRIRKNPGDSTCLFWSCLWRRTRRMTGICTIWAGSTCSVVNGRTASAP